MINWSSIKGKSLQIDLKIPKTLELIKHSRIDDFKISKLSIDRLE